MVFMPGDKTPFQLSPLFEVAAELPIEHPLYNAQKIHFANLEMMFLSSLNDDFVLPGGFINRLRITPAKLEKLKELRNKKDFLDFFIQLIINDILERIDELIRYHLTEMGRLIDEIAHDQEILDILNEDRFAIKRALERYRKDRVLIIDDLAQRAIG